MTRFFTTRLGQRLQVQYRLARLEEQGALMELLRSARAQHQRQGFTQWTDAYLGSSRLAEEIERGEQCVGVINGEIAISYVLNRDCLPEYALGQWRDETVPYLVLHRLCLAPAYQHLGLASQLLQHLDMQLLEIGVGAIRLDVFSQNRLATQLYAKAGFQQVGSFELNIGKMFLLEKYL